VEICLSAKKNLLRHKWDLFRIFDDLANAIINHGLVDIFCLIGFKPPEYLLFHFDALISELSSFPHKHRFSVISTIHVLLGHTSLLTTMIHTHVDVKNLIGENGPIDKNLSIADTLRSFPAWPDYR